MMGGALLNVREYTSAGHLAQIVPSNPGPGAYVGNARTGGSIPSSHDVSPDPFEHAVPVWRCGRYCAASPVPRAVICGANRHLLAALPFAECQQIGGATMTGVQRIEVMRGHHTDDHRTIFERPDREPGGVRFRAVDVFRTLAWQNTARSHIRPYRPRVSFRQSLLGGDIPIQTEPRWTAAECSDT